MAHLDLKVIIGDDEAAMRKVLKKTVLKVDGFEVVGEAEDGDSAFSLAENIHPDVVFLDVEMPKLNGIECAKKITEIYPKTIIIFATAHQDYMSDAFQLYAFDYLIKPFKLERVYQTLDRIKILHNKEQTEQTEQIEQTQKTLHFDNSIGKILIKSKEAISFVDFKDIILVEREDRNTVIYTNEGNYTTSESLSDLEERLDKGSFFRCHKSYIINITKIHQIYPYGRWTHIIKLKNTERDALITHDKYEELKKMFNL